VDANERFVGQVSELLEQLEQRRSEMSEKMAARVELLRSKVEEQQEVVMPRLQKTLKRFDEQRAEAQPRLRRVITGREDLTIEEFMEKYKVIKLMDKIVYTSSILFLLATEYVAMRIPEYYRFFFAFTAFAVMVSRVYLYGKKNMQWFMADYCYSINALAIINAVAFPKSSFFWQVNFVAANGPLMWAIVAWRNSLVFHDFDKVSSILIHFAPALLTYTERWNAHPSPMCQGPLESDCQMSPLSAFVVPLVVYSAWQTVYLLVTEVFERKRFENDPTLMTSLRWIVRDEKNQIHGLMVLVGRELRLMGPDEELDLKNRPFVAIGLFVAFQFLFTIATFVPTYVFFKSRFAHRVFMIFVLTVSLWNGAGFIFHVFVSRYEEQLSKKTQALKKKREAKLNDSEKHTSGHKRSSKRASKKRDSSRMKGFCATPNESERAELQREKDALNGDVEDEPEPESQSESDDEEVPVL